MAELIEPSIKKYYEYLRSIQVNDIESKIRILDDVNKIVLSLDGGCYKYRYFGKCCNCGSDHSRGDENPATYYVLDREHMKGIYCHICCGMPK
jgi:hypothetical protein